MKTQVKNKTIIILAITLITLLAGCSSNTESSKEMLRPVRFIIAGEGDTRQERTFSGFAQVDDDVTLSFRTAGIIIEKRAAKGQSVKKGDLLGKLDNVEAQLAYEKAIAEVDRANSEMHTAETNFNRIRLLYEQGAKPLIEYESAKNTFRSSTSLYETALRNRDIQKTQLSYGIIYAPADGIIMHTDGSVNERIAAGHEFVVLNTSGGRMKVVVNLPESVINSVSLQMPVEITFSALSNQIFSGKISEISPDISAESATYPVDVEIINPTSEIKPGMAAGVSFNLAQNQGSEKRKLVLPIEAVSEDAQSNFVFVIEKETENTGRAVKKQVVIGQLTPFGFEINNGVSAGDMVVTAGLQTLLDGQRVKIQ